MKHISQDELILHYYGEGGSGAEKHIATCAECRSNFELLSRTLSAIAFPEPPSRQEGYGVEVWSRIRHKLPERPRAIPWWSVANRRWAAAACVVVLIAVAFVAGRYTNRPPARALETANNAQLPQKVLVVALGDYLDRSEMLLVEVAHANRPEDLDLNTQRRNATELIATNRLYRQTAQRVGDAGTDALLDQLERVLVQLAHTPPEATPADIQQLHQEIESGGLLFKVRVAQVHMKAQSGSDNPVRATEDRSPIL